MSVPCYLMDPDNSGHIYGKVRYDEQVDSYWIEAEPAVLEMAKRVFPGSREWGNRVRFPATRRAVGELNWLMLRYPLTIETPDKFHEHRQQAIAHALRREGNMIILPATPPPTFTGTLYPYQQEGVAFMVANERTLLADDMGLGKTVTALAAIATAEAFPVLLVVPTNVQRQWRLMAGTFLDLPIPGQQPLVSDAETRGKRMCHLIQGLKPHGLPECPVYITHYGLLRGWRSVLPDMGFKAVVFDEIQELRHRTTDKYSVASLVAGSSRYVWGLSGTPVYNYGAEIWSVMNILDYHCLGDYESFTREWCAGYDTERVVKPDVLGDYLRREGLMLRRRKSDVQSQLPPKRRVIHLVDSDQTRYNQLIAEAVRLAQGYADIKDWHEKGRTKRLIEGAT